MVEANRVAPFDLRATPYLEGHLQGIGTVVVGGQWELL